MDDNTALVVILADTLNLKNPRAPRVPQSVFRPTRWDSTTPITVPTSSSSSSVAVASTQPPIATNQPQTPFMSIATGTPGFGPSSGTSYSRRRGGLSKTTLRRKKQSRRSRK